MKLPYKYYEHGGWKTPTIFGEHLPEDSKESDLQWGQLR